MQRLVLVAACAWGQLVEPARAGELAPPKAVEPRIVLIVGAGDASQMEARLESELRLLGFVVERVTERPSNDELARWAIEREASGVLVVHREPLRIVMWTRGANARTDENLITIQSTEARPRVELLALQAVELLRGILLDAPREQKATGDLSTERPTAAIGHSPPDESQASGPDLSKKSGKIEPQKRHWRASVGPGVAWSPGGVNVLPGFHLAVSHFPLTWLGFQLDGFVSAGASPAGAPGGALNVRAYTVGASALAKVTPVRRLDCSLGLGVGAVVVAWNRQSEISSLNVQSQDWAPSLDARVSSTYWLYPFAGVRLDANAQITRRAIALDAPKPSDSSLNPSGIGGTEPVDVRFGQPVLIGSVAFELRF